MIDNIKYKKFKYNRNEFFFCIAYTLLIVYRILKSSTIGIDDKGITYILISILFILNIFQIKIRKSKILGIGLISVTVLLSIINTMDPVLPVVLLALIASKNIEFKKIAKISLSVTAFMVFLVVVLALLGIIPDTQTYRYFGENKITCHGIGFNHSSALPTYYFFIFLNYFYLSPKKRKVIYLLIGTLIGYCIFKLCAERLRFYMLIIASALIFLKPFESNKFYKLKKYIMTLVFPICCIITLILGYYYNSSNNSMYKLNIYLSNRLYYEHYTFNNYPVTWFGQDIMMGEDVTKFKDGSTYFYIDAAYVYLLFEYGIQVFGAIIIAYMYGCKKSLEFKDKYLCIWFILLAIDSIIGNQILSIWSIPIIFIPFCKVNSLNE